MQKFLILSFVFKLTSCIACNKNQPVNNEKEFVTCKDRKMTTLPSVSPTKLIPKWWLKLIRTSKNFTGVNDAIRSFFYSKTMSNNYFRVEGRWNDKTFLTTGQMRELYLLHPAKKVYSSNVILACCRERVSLQALKVCQNKQREKKADKKLSGMWTAGN